MADRSAIEWTDASWNPIRARNKATGKVGWHCEHATTGCEFCYSEGFNKRLGTGLPFKPGHRKDIEIFLDEQMLTQPLRWKRPRKIFVCSMTDAFAEFVTDEMLDKMFAVMALAPQHTFQVLTKRAKRMREYLTNARQEATRRIGIRSPGFTVVQRVQGKVADYVRRGMKFDMSFGFGPVYPEDWDRAKPYLRPFPLDNVWLGVSTERQQEADERIPELLATPAAVRFISAEPLLGPIELGEHLHAYACHDCFNGRTRTTGHFFDGKCPACGGTGAEKQRLDWVIVGGESGPAARPMHPDWARSLRDQCAAANVPFFFKQWGEWAPGECASGRPTKSERIANYFDETWDNPGWSFGSVTPRESEEMHVEDEPNVYRLGKKAAGRLLDGVEHNGFPTREALP